MSPPQILITVMMYFKIVVDRSTENAKVPHPISFLPQYECQRKCVLQSKTMSVTH